MPWWIIEIVGVLRVVSIKRERETKRNRERKREKECERGRRQHSTITYRCNLKRLLNQHPLPPSQRERERERDREIKNYVDDKGVTEGDIMSI